MFADGAVVVPSGLRVLAVCAFVFCGFALGCWVVLSAFSTGHFPCAALCNVAVPVALVALLKLELWHILFYVVVSVSNEYAVVDAVVYLFWGV